MQGGAEAQRTCYYFYFVRTIRVITVITVIVNCVVCFFLYRNLRSKDQGKLLINLCTSLLALYITFIICGHVTTVPVLCGFMAALLQYFMLVFFGWTAAGAVLLYRKTVTVFATGESFVWKAAIVVWCKFWLRYPLQPNDGIFNPRPYPIEPVRPCM